MADLLIEEIPHTWPFEESRTDRTNQDADDLTALHRALTWAVRHGWTRVETARWSRPHTLSSRRWTPGGRVIVDWGTGSQLAICYRAPLQRPDRLKQWAYWVADTCECPLGGDTDPHDPGCPWGLP